MYSNIHQIGTTNIYFTLLKKNKQVCGRLSFCKNKIQLLLNSHKHSIHFLFLVQWTFVKNSNLFNQILHLSIVSLLQCFTCSDSITGALYPELLLSFSCFVLCNHGSITQFTVYLLVVWHKMIWFKMNEFGLDSDKIYKYTSSGGKQKNRKKK